MKIYKKIFGMPGKQKTASPSTKKKEHQLRNFFLVLACLIILSGFFLLKGGITGLFLGQENWLSYNYSLDINLNADGEETFTIEEHPFLFDLKSLKLSGKILGNGEVKVYLETQGERYLVLDNEAAEEDELSSITAYLIAVEEEPEEEIEEEETEEEEEETEEEVPAEEPVEEEAEEEIPEEIPEEEPIEEPILEEEPLVEENITVELPGEIPENVTEEVEENITIELPEEIPENITEIPENITEESLANVSLGQNLTTNITINQSVDNVTTNETSSGRGGGGTTGIPTITNETESQEINETVEEEEEIVEEIIVEGPQTYHVNLTYQEFEPEVLTINTGDTIIWTNLRGERTPRAAMIVGARNPYRDIRSEELEPGESYSWTFKVPGTYHIVDGVITTLESKITVEGESTEELETLHEIEFNNLCSETCLLPSGLNSTGFNLVFEVEEGTELELTGMWYALENLTEATTITYEKIKDDPRYEVIIDSVAEEDNTLVIIFHHDFKKKLAVEVEGEINYTLDTDKKEIKSNKNITLRIYGWDNDYFRLRIGEEVVEFGVQEEFDFNPEIKDSEGELVEYDLEFEDVDTEEIEENEEIRMPKGFAIQTEQTIDVKEGKYNIKIEPKEHPIKSIEIKDVEISDDVTEFIDIDDVEEVGELANYVEVYAIDPTKFNFTNVTVTVTAKGTSLYKCKDWNFTTQTCYDEWVLFKSDLIPGQDYTFTLTPEDPGFAETNYIPNATHKAYFFQDTALPSTHTPGYGTEYTSAQYTAVNLSDNSRAQFSATLGNNHEVTQYNFTLAQNYSSINNFTIIWEGYSSLTRTATGVNLYLWDFTDSSWTLANSTTSSSEQTLTYTSSNKQDFINSTNSELWIMVESRGKTLLEAEKKQLTTYVDFVQLTIDYNNDISQTINTSKAEVYDQDYNFEQDITSDLQNQGTYSNLNKKILRVQFSQNLTNGSKILIYADAKKKRDLMIYLNGTFGDNDDDDNNPDRIGSIVAQKNTLRWYNITLTGMSQPQDIFDIYFNEKIHYYYIIAQTGNITPRRLINLNANLSAVLEDNESIDVEENEQDTPKWVILKNNVGKRIGKFKVHFENAPNNIDMSTFDSEIDVNSRKTFVHMPFWSEHISYKKKLYIPSTGKGSIYICPNATSLEATHPNCPGKFTISVGQTVNNVTLNLTTINGTEYYVASGITGTGGGEENGTYCNVIADIYVDENNLNPKQNALQIKWDISSIPNGSTINKADLCLYITSKTGSPDDDTNASRVDNQTWTESISASDYQSLSLTNTTSSLQWNSTTVNTTACLDVTTFVQEDVNLGNTYTSFRIEDLDHPITNTYAVHNSTTLNVGGGGILDETRLIFASREHATVAYRPKLTINYTEGADTTPPASVTNLNNQSAGTTWIYWNWTNPRDADFNESIVYLDGVWKLNTSNNYYNATGLNEGTSYTITVHTKDTTGNINNTDVNSTVITLTSCAENWTVQYTACNISDNRTKYYTDNNSCGTTNDLPGDNGTVESCNYCSYSITNTSWTSWQNQTICLINDTQQQNRSKTEYDANYDSCYAVTGLASDLWNSGNNNTYWEYNSTSCDYCTPSWYEINTSCASNDQFIGWYNDSNTCYAITGLASDNNPSANNTYACDYIISTNFDGSTTNFTTVNLSNIQNLILERTSHGIINFTEAVVIDRSLDLDTYVDISDNLIDLDSTNLPELNKSAILTLYNLSFVNPTLIRNGETCPASICTRISYSGGNLIFNITTFTNYSTSEGPYCGDSSCNGDESCSSCVADCGSCPPSGGGSSSGGGIAITPTNQTCEEKWTCTKWNECTNGKQTRQCQDTNNCSTTVFKPNEIKGCGVSCEEKWACTTWGPCVDENQIRICKDVNNCGTGINKPIETQSCQLEETQETLPTGTTITGQAVVSPFNLPNPKLLIPTILLLIVLIALLMLRHVKLSKKMRRLITALHISIIIIIFILVFLTFKPNLLSLDFLTNKVQIALITIITLGVISLITFYFRKIYKTKKAHSSKKDGKKTKKKR